MASAAALYQEEFTPCRAQGLHRLPTAEHGEKQLLAASLKLISKFLWAPGILNLPIKQFHTSLNKIRLFF